MICLTRSRSHPLAWTWIHYKAHKIIWRFPKNSNIAPYREYFPDSVHLNTVDNKAVTETIYAVRSD